MASESKSHPVISSLGGPIARSERVTGDRQTDATLRVLERLLRGCAGNPGLRLWDGHSYSLGAGPHTFTLVLRDPLLLRRLVTANNPVLLAEAYFQGQLDVEGDFYCALALKDHLRSLTLSWRTRLALISDAWRLPARPLAKLPDLGPARKHPARRAAHRHSRTSDRAAIAFHYDVSNAFYGLWLDERRVYSCAYFETPTDTLDQAQSNKLAHICRKLRLKSGDRLLDIGCGWGALVCWAAQHHGVRAHGITLSRAQLDYAKQRIAEQGLSELATVELRDYRDLAGHGSYDRVASVGMIEHVGLARVPDYLAAVHRVLRPGGLFLNHGITHDDDGWKPSVETDFINRYVFPGGEFDRISSLQLGMERAGFEVEDVEALRRHYALTLRHWVRRLEQQHEAALREVDETTYRLWRLYMAASALEFESGGTGIYQVLASRRGGDARLPLTRRDLYPGAAQPRTAADEHGRAAII